jgi:hypothetical protein
MNTCNVSSFIKILPLLAAGFPLAAQIEATDPGTGILVTDSVLYSGRRIAAGTERAEAIRALGGNVRVAQKARQTSAIALTAEFGRAVHAVHSVDMSLQMRAIRTGSPIPSPDESVEQVGAAITRLIVPRCGACWIEMVELALGKGETLRVVLQGPSRDALSVSAIVLDKSRNELRRDLYKPWTGRRYVYLADQASRITQEPGRLQVDQIDPSTGAVIPTP